MVFLLQSHSASPQGFGPFVSYIIGWIYFLAWSASFYPQVILNWQRKSVQGLSVDFIHLNALGFFCYAVFNLAFFFSSEIQEEYRRRSGGQENLVRANDVFSAVHAFILSNFTLVQTYIYKRDESQRLSIPSKMFIVGAVVSTFSVLSSAMWSKSIERIDVLYFVSYVKLVISVIKYCPQVYINYKVRSTVGWSIGNILLDFSGGVLSTAQIILDAYLSGDWSSISGDPAKFGLGFVSIAFDVIFIVQHYILYRGRDDFYASLSMRGSEQERQPLIPPPNEIMNF